LKAEKQARETAESTKIADRSSVSAVFGDVLATKLLPDSLYLVHQVVSLDISGGLPVGRVADPVLSSLIAKIRRGEGKDE
jgi:hypothetical protein